MKSVDFVVVIPARYGSTRLPGKPLLEIAGKPMIQRVYEQAVQSHAKKVLIATDDQRIADLVHEFGGHCCMTRGDHVSGTDRLQEVAQQCGWPDDAIVVNVQGDEPLIPPSVINQVANNLASHPLASIATLCEPIADMDTFLDPNVVKVVRDGEEFALYFSRAPIPWPRDAFRQSRAKLPENLSAQRHIGIYAYRSSFLHRFVNWPPALIEQLESLEQLRALAHGIRIHVQPACAAVPGGVDTEKDLDHVRQYFALKR